MAALGVAKSEDFCASIQLNYLAALITQTFYTANRPIKVTAIRGRPMVAGSDGSAVSLSFYKTPSGTALASGTLLHTGSYNMKGTIDTNQTLTLSTALSDVTLAAGDSIGYVLTGTATAAIGNITVHIEPA